MIPLKYEHGSPSDDLGGYFYQKKKTFALALEIKVRSFKISIFN